MLPYLHRLLYDSDTFLSLVEIYFILVMLPVAVIMVIIAILIVRFK